jgi:Outer membrane receptor for ferrienterochelin and colicins
MHTKYLVVIAFLASGLYAHAQVIKGTVTGNQQPVAGATVRVKGTNLGATTDSIGQFTITVNEKGKYVLEFSSVGYKPKRETVTVSDSLVYVNVFLTSSAKTLGEVVVIGAGAFEASDKAKGASLTPMDAVTVAGNGGDIANSLRSLPGAQQVGEKEGLFVRGGTSEEAKQFVDGVLLKNPNYNSVPGILQPARINPFLFKGILFSTGGYSALYGQALSSALILETIDLPEESSANLHIFPQSLGLGIQKLAKDKNSSYGATLQYGNLNLYNKIVKQQVDFSHAPEYMKGDANFRVKTSKTGMLKFYVNMSANRTGLRNPDADSAGLLNAIDVKGRNAYTTISWREQLPNHWKIDVAAAYNFNKDEFGRVLQNHAKEHVSIPGLPQKNTAITTKSHFAQGRTVFTKSLTQNQTLRFGAEYFYSRDQYSHEDTLSNLTDNLVAAYAEDDIHITRRLAARIGVRAEHADLLNQWSVAPRIGLAYKIDNTAQINMAYGIFYQKPENIYLVQQPELLFSRATHYIVNFQKKARNRLLRLEAYYKKYHNLVSTVPAVNNDGDGYARGIELFWRDKKTFRNFDYWISYTYLDTKRKYLDYPYAIRPNYTTPHTMAIALKKFIQEINLSANLSYTLSTGRPYYHIQKGAIHDQGTTNTYNNMNVSFAYLFTLFPKWKHKDFSGIGVGMNNILGTQPVFGYTYSIDGHRKVPVMLPAQRSFYFGIFMSFGIDRRDDFINDNL